MSTTFNSSAENDSSPNVTLVEPDELPWPLWQQIFFCSWLLVSMSCAIVGNLMVIVVVARHRGMQTRTNMFLVNLAIADFFVGTLLAPFSFTTLIKGTWIFGDAMCKINGFMNAVCFITSIHTLMYISIHKFISITRPFSRILNNWKILVMISCAWIWAIICGIFTMTVLNHTVYKNKTMQCGPEYPHELKQYVHHVIIQLTNIVLPLGVMIFAYSKMYNEFRRHAVRMRKNTTLQSDQIIGQQKKVTKTLFLVLACFILCWLPYATYTTYVSIAKDKSKIPAWMNAVAYCFMYMNSGCNPIIYAWRSPSFREGYKEILCQRPAYIVSDDTIRDIDSPGIIRRLTTLLHTSFQGTVSHFGSRRNSETSSIRSRSISRSPSCSSPKPTHSLLRRATSKTATGSSIIRKDGSLIITKNGKIISVRPDKGGSMIKRDHSFQYFKNLPPTSRRNGISRSLTDINDITRDKIELSPLLQNGHTTSITSDASSEVSIPSTSELKKMAHHALLTKIDSVDETQDNSRDLKSRSSLEASLKSKGRSISSFRTSKSSEDRQCHSLTDMNIQELEVGDQSVAMETDVFLPSESPVDEVFTPSVNTTPVMITITDTSSSPPKSRKHKKFFSRSSEHLEKDTSKEAKHYSPIKHSKHKSKSTDIFTVPLLRCPSLERLDFPSVIPRRNSDVSNSTRPINLKSPLFKRRWLSNKSVDQNECADKNEKG